MLHVAPRLTARTATVGHALRPRRAARHASDRAMGIGTHSSVAVEEMLRDIVGAIPNEWRPLGDPATSRDKSLRNDHHCFSTRVRREETPDNVVRGHSGRAGQVWVEWDLTWRVHRVCVPEVAAANELIEGDLGIAATAGGRLHRHRGLLSVATQRLSGVKCRAVGLRGVVLVMLRSIHSETIHRRHSRCDNRPNSRRRWRAERGHPHTQWRIPRGPPSRSGS